MRKLIILSFITLDGVMQAPGGPEEDTSGKFKYGGWLVPFSDDITNEAMAEVMSRSFSLLLGRKTYDIFARYWPHHEDIWPGVNAATKYVVSHNASFNPGWNNSVLISSDVANEIKKIKEQNGPELHVYGSADLIQTLMKHDLVDEFMLKIFPVTLGTGKRLFVEGTIPATFKLTESKVSSTGVIIANYARAGEVKTGSF